MSREKQNEANRRNARSSTGPRTPAGKARSSLNALKHGLTAAQVLVPSEDTDDFNAHADSLRDRFAPVDAFESILVEQIIVAAWRLRRSRILETLVFTQRTAEVERSQQEREEERTDPVNSLGLAFRKECSYSKALETLSR